MDNVRGKTVLVIEDDTSLGKVIIFKLNKNGYLATLTSDAESALAILNSGKKFDFIWLDLLLPGMSGIDFLKKIRLDDALKNERVAVVSISDSYDNKQISKQLDVVDYIVKNQYNLNDIVERVISSDHSRDLISTR